MSNISNEIYARNIQYLYNVSDLLPNIALKSYHLTKCRLTEFKGSSVLPLRTVRSTVRCPRCNVLHSDSGSTNRIEAQKQNRFIRRLLKKQKDDNLTKYQKSSLLHLWKQNYNQLVTKCNACHKIVKEKLIKPKPAKKPTIVEDTWKTPRKNKRKKKDKFCGLNKSIVLTVTPKIPKNPPPTKPKTMREIKKEKKQTSMKKKKQNEKINKLASILNTSDVSKSYLKEFLVNK